ncbi:TPA: hypothetical protein U2C36_000773 [Streptococcus suis]|nr:hypothetical protein [Streptococcus suis]
MFDIFGKLEEMIQEILLDMIKGTLTSMFTDLNHQLDFVSGQVGQSPSQFNAEVFSFIKHINDSVVLPIAGLVITAVLCLELIRVVMQKNNMAEVDTFEFFKYVIKMWVAVYLVSHAFEFAMAAFDLGQHMIGQATGVIHGETSISSEQITAMVDSLKDKNIGELAGIVFELQAVKLTIQIISLIILIITYGRMFEIYAYSSVAALPFATLGNREWGQLGHNYIRGLFALALQGLFLVICFGIYAVLLRGVKMTDIHMSVFSILGYTVLLGFMMLKTGTLARSIMNAH